MIHSPAHLPKAFSLVEVTLAIGLTAFCLVAIFGLLPIGLSASHSAIEQTEANGVITMVTADLRATRPPTIAERSSSQPIASPQFAISIPASPVSSQPAPTTLYFSDDGKVCASAVGARYRMTVTFPENGSDPMAATFANLQVSWPASVPAANASGKVQTFIAVDRN